MQDRCVRLSRDPSTTRRAEPDTRRVIEVSRESSGGEVVAVDAVNSREGSIMHTFRLNEMLLAQGQDAYTRNIINIQAHHNHQREVHSTGRNHSISSNLLQKQANKRATDRCAGRYLVRPGQPPNLHWSAGCKKRACYRWLLLRAM